MQNVRAYKIYLVRVEQDDISKHGHLDYHGVGSCKMWARVEGTTIVLTNAIKRCVAKLYYVFGSVEWMCLCSCT